MLKTVATATALALCLLASASSAEAADCSRGVTARGRAANPQNYDPPKSYDAETLATARAKHAWSATVANACPGFSTKWWLSRSRNVLCEGTAGGVACEIKAVPLGFYSYLVD